MTKKLSEAFFGDKKFTEVRTRSLRKFTASCSQAERCGGQTSR